MSAEVMLGFVALVILLAFAVKVLLSFLAGVREGHSGEPPQDSA